MKLRKLILTGFKSFADRTEFDFHDGVSGVVGPNGCGKSNIVDAMRWVLGERSAKSLRGSEMMDVIFNGSAARKPAGMAEVTLVFANDDGQLRSDVGDVDGEGLVSVGRRLYRSGQSEYLINKAPCRLKDVREMFMDTGVGVDAYSIIGQGKVEVFLQASQEERRSVFDEAAGISKYKARRNEAQRRLERVEQNLLRLNDILAEVQKRLRSIKYQAGKARSYQTYVQRLHEQRCLYYLAQYHILSGQRKSLQQKLDEGNDALTSVQTKIDRLEAGRSATEVEVVDLERAGRELEAKIAAVGAQISAAQERAEMLTARVKELGDQIVQASARCEELEAQIARQTEDSAAKSSELAEAERIAAQAAQECESQRQQYVAGQLSLAQMEHRLEDEKVGTIDLLRRTAQLHNQISSSGVRRESLGGQQHRVETRAQELEGVLRVALTDKAQADAKLSDVVEVLSAAQERLEQAKSVAHQAAESEQQTLDKLSAAREERSAKQSRRDALGEMIQRMEGVGEGARKVLKARQAGKLVAVRGMLGNMLEADRDHAEVVEAALAGADEWLVADNCAALQACRDELAGLVGESGSVEVICLDAVRPFNGDFDATACPNVVARAIDFVSFPAEIAPAVWALLGRTLVVRNLADAQSADVPAGFRFVTLAGDVVEADGRVRIGAAGRTSGLVVRRSEWQDLRKRCEELDASIAELETNHRSAKTQRQHLDEVQQGLRTAIYEATAEKVEAEGASRRLGARIAEVQKEQPLLANDLKNLAEEIEAAVRAEHEAKGKAAELETLRVEREKQIETLKQELAASQQRQQELQTRMTELKVAQASADEKKRSLAEAIAALARQLRSMEQDFQNAKGEIELNRQRRTDAEVGITKAKQSAEELYSQLEVLNKESADVEESRRGLTEKLESIRHELGEHRKRADHQAGVVNAVRVELGEASVRVENLISRASDEGGMELLKLYETYQHDENRDWDAVKVEIQDLQEKIERLGNVNLDAIAENDELETRREFLEKHLADVRSSRDQLQELITRINNESRERFLSTFEQVRTHFQELFRKLFGGGRADIMLLNPDDVLESGVEIVARPPGKELRSLSLLSGGEKTMTALALMFSVFRTRPSPFCVLDEVDAALDEANTERFGKLVQDFIGQSQFIVITHAKRTMSMAGVLYGVTMQEAGVSKRISVRFEDAGKKLDAQLAPAKP